MNAIGDNSVLLVDDNQDILDYLAEILTESGYKPVCCTEVADATRKTQNQAFSCILLDLNLKGGTAIRIIETLEANPKNPNHDTPIMIVSGQLDKSSLEQLKGRVASIVVKPIESKQLLEKLKAFSSVRVKPKKTA